MTMVLAAAMLLMPFQQSQCEEYRITGYVRGAHSPWTSDGTSVWTREAVAAASYNVPMGWRVQVAGIGTFRVADRGGGLGARHIDILVDSYSEAYSLTGMRSTCVLPPGDDEL